MSLLSRLVAPQGEEVKIPVHQFMAALAEGKRGAPGVDLASISAVFELDAGEQADLATFLLNFYGGIIDREMIHDVLMLGERGIYTVQNCADRLVNVNVADVLPLIVQRQIEVLNRATNDLVLSGCAVSAQGTPDMTLAVAKGAVMTNGVLRAVTAGNVTITDAHATWPRFDVVVVDSSGAKQVRAGTPAASPLVASLSSGDVALVFVYVRPADTAISSGEILDARVVATSGPITIGKLTTQQVSNNTNAIVTPVALTLPSGLFLAGRILRVKMGGTMLLNSGTPTVTMRIQYNGTTLFQDVTSAATADVDRLAWALDVCLIARGDAVQALNGLMALSPVGAKTAPNTGVGDLATAAAFVTPINGSSAVDSDAGDRVFQVQFQMSVANASNEIVTEYATGELL